MTIYDRFSSSSTRRRRQYALCGRFPGLYRVLWVAKYGILAGMGMAAGLFACELFAALMGNGLSMLPLFPVWLYPCAAVLLGGWMAFYIADQGTSLFNLHAMGMDETHFHVLSVQYQSRKQVCMAELKAIRILPGKKPLERFHAGGGWDYRRARERYENSYSRSVRQGGILCLPFLACVQGKFMRPPMALLIPETGSDNSVWLQRGWPETNFLRDHIGFAVCGDREAAFVRLIQNSSCPVMVKGQYRAYIESIFHRNHLDIDRLHIEE